MVKAMLLDVNYLVILPDVHRDMPLPLTHEEDQRVPEHPANPQRCHNAFSLSASTA
jgi:hypothetical protein